MAVFLEIDGSVNKINAKIDSARDSLNAMAQDYERIGEASKSAVSGAVSDQQKLATAASKGGKELNKQAGIIEKLSGHLKRLETGQRKATSVKDIKKYNVEIAKTRAAMAALSTAGVGGVTKITGVVGASKAAFAALRTTLLTTFAPLFAAGAAVAGVQKIISTVTAYEQTAADLQAITGANADTLDFLKQSAVEVGITTTASAGQTLEAYKLIASAKPELLDNAEGLAQITKEAVTLTEAMGGDLPTAASNLTDIMNQFNAPADQAARFVNTLAAGSKEGSADVGQLAASLLVAGTESKSSNVSFEESIGILEVLAEKGRKGAEAGTGLRNVLSKLSATDVLPKDATDRLTAAGVDIDQLSDKSLTFTDRLRALAPIQNDANALTALFGLENKATAQILLSNIDRADELTQAVTGTNTAYEQAAIRTATASGEFDKLKNTVSALVVEGGDGLGGFVAVIIRFVRNGLLFFRDQAKDLKASIDPVISGIGDLINNIGRALTPLRQAGDSSKIWATAIKIINVPLKVLFAILGAGIGVLTAVTEKIAEATNSSPRFGAAFSAIGDIFRQFLNIFGQLPSFVSGGLAAIFTFATETKNAISELGGNIGEVLKEAFNIPKLIRSGTGDLEAAVGELFVNPFTGIGTKAAEAFNEAFESAESPKPVDIKVNTISGDVSGQSDSDPVNNTGPGNAASEEAKKQAEAAAKEQVRITEETARLRLAAMKDGADKELALENARYNDLISQLAEYGIDTADATEQHELNKFRIKQKFLAEAADLEGLNGEERINFLFEQTKAEIDAIESALAGADGSISDEQIKQLNLLRKAANEEYLEELNKFQTEETKAAQEHEIALLELRTGEFDTLKEFEEFKQNEILKIRLKGAEAQLAIIEDLKGAESDAALSLRGTINSIKSEIEAIANSTKGAQGFSIYSLLGIDPADPANKSLIEGVEKAGATTIEVLGQINALRLESANTAIEAKDKEIAAIEEKIEAKESELEEQIALDEEGLANNEEKVRADIDVLKEQQRAEKVEREKALNEKKKIQRQQAIVDTITQGTSLITAAANIFNSVSLIPFVGPAIGAGLVAAMIGSFIAAKSKVFQNISSVKAKRGMVGTVTGRGHDQGGERFGDHIEVESGEDFGILSRPASKTFGSAFKRFTEAANKGDRRGMAEILKEAVGPGVNIESIKTLEKKEAAVINIRRSVEAKTDNPENKKTNDILTEMLKQQKTQKTKISYVPGAKIIKKKGYTKIVKTG